jgi:hypothetical protein
MGYLYRKPCLFIYIKTNINLEKLISCALDIENILNKKLLSKIKDLYKNVENFKPLKL